MNSQRGQDQEFSELRERQGRIEQTVASLAETIKTLADNQQTIQEGQGKVATELKGVLTILQSREGRIDLKMILPVLGLLIGIIGPLAAMFLAPVRAQLDYNTTEIHSMRDSGSPVSRRAIDMLDERARAIRVDVDRLDVNEHRRLEEEASLGRQLLYNRTVTPAVVVAPPATPVTVTPPALPILPAPSAPIPTPALPTQPITGTK